MKNLTNKILVLAVGALSMNLVLSACKDSFFETPPSASLTEEVLSTKKGLDGLLVVEVLVEAHRMPRVVFVVRAPR